MPERTLQQEVMQWALVALTWVLAIAFAFDNSPVFPSSGWLTILVGLSVVTALNGKYQLMKPGMAGVVVWVWLFSDMLFRIWVAIFIRMFGLDVTATVITCLLIEGALALIRHISRWVRDMYQSVIATVGF